MCRSTHSSSRLWMSAQESSSFGSEYIRNRILNVQARLLVSCFSRLGLDLPLKPAAQNQDESRQKVGPVAPNEQHAGG